MSTFDLPPVLTLISETARTGQADGDCRKATEAWRSFGYALTVERQVEGPGLDQRVLIGSGLARTPSRA